jgi:hypothetical protein
MDRKVGIVSFVVVLTVISLNFLTQAAEKKKISGTNKPKQTVSQTTVSPGDVPNHELVSRVYIATVTSSDPELGKYEEYLYEQADQIAGTGSHRGYTMKIHPNGDRFYGSYEGTHKTITKGDGSWEATFEGTWKWTNGTGKFKNIKGNGTYKGKASPEGGISNWEGEVEY